VDARLIVVGAGPRLREYRRYVATRRIRDVEFVGHVPLEAKLRYFASADVFCAPSTGQESFGIVLLEAMAAGLPIVASDIHGYKNVVSRDVEGYLVEPRNPRALAAALYKLARDPELRNRMGEAGRAKAPEYSWEHVTEQVVAYYQIPRLDLVSARSDHAAAPRLPQPSNGLRYARSRWWRRTRCRYTPGRRLGCPRPRRGPRRSSPLRNATGLRHGAWARPRLRHGRRIAASRPRRPPVCSLNSRVTMLLTCPATWSPSHATRHSSGSKSGPLKKRLNVSSEVSEPPQ
jgi:hypothetical protein